MPASGKWCSHQNPSRVTTDWQQPMAAFVVPKLKKSLAIFWLTNQYRLPIHVLRRNDMGFFEQLQQQTEAERQHVLTAPVIQAVLDGRFDVNGYRYFLEQAFHHVRHTVPLMMACGAHLPDRLESVREALVEYIEDEYGHDAWILNDIEATGGDRQQVRANKPCLPIELMVSFLYDQINRGNPAAFFEIGR